ncbi:C-terminal domain of CinA type S [Actinokineospora spheciospongiae]|uniref:C-terminal domain of CinA type S n=1 Tax=Actinokineospora spheciospongiae TaxID=909613 RepID=W7ID85_9PSEU|nr:CinA family protein [Actinokineospora spheciospongiae]EWC58810.1 C-terminal domain of CinA type S [Actinokineospora spheciospongiae]
MTGLGLLPGLPSEPVAAVVAALRARGETVATAESLTGGLLTAALTSVAGSSAVVRGGLVVYATDLKATLADVDADLLAERGPVDPDVAVALAEGARLRCAATYGVGLTGVAGPGPQDGKPVGTVYAALSGPDGTLLSSPVATGGREEVRSVAVRAALDLIARAVGTLSG